MGLKLPDLLSLFLFLLLIIEGLGISSGHEITYLLIIIVSPIFFLHMLIHKKDAVFPQKTSLLFLLFFASQVLSTIFSVNINNSVLYLFFTIAIYFVFLCVYNYCLEFKKSTQAFLLVLSAIFVLYSAAIDVSLINLFIPQSGYQFVYSLFGSHNHLGDFLTLPAILMLFNIYNKRSVKTSVIIFLILVPFILLSYSRSAYFTLAFSALFMHILFLRQRPTLIQKIYYRLFILIVILGTVVLIISTTAQANKHPLMSRIHNYFVQNNELQPKDLLGSRIEYFREAYLAYKENPLIGIGPNNFLSASNKYTLNPYKATTQSPHNIFAEVAVGQGIIGLLSFTALLFFVLKHSKKGPLFFIFLGMLINFQTDYTYQIYSFYLLFFVIIATVLQDNTISLRKTGAKLRHYFYGKISK